jgi:Kinesin motor domain
LGKLSGRGRSSLPASCSRKKDMSSQNVKVVVRIRPLIASELLASEAICLKPDLESSTVGIIGNDALRFAFDQVFDIEATQNAVFQDCAEPLLAKLLEGINGTVLAYGQTSSGKTFTMGSVAGGASLATPVAEEGETGSTGSSAAEIAKGESDQRGIIPRVAEALFAKLEAVSSSAAPGSFSWSVRCTFVEIFGEQIKDLLTPLGSASKVLNLRESTAAVTLVGATERPCASAAALLAAIEEGSLVRATAQTKMNATSSRSHAIFSIVLEQKKKTGSSVAGGAGAAPTAPSVETRLISKLNLVDLAGSERLKRTMSERKRLKEGTAINKGLLALGKVIDTLASQQEEKSRLLAAAPSSAAGGSSRRGSTAGGAATVAPLGHVPYRDSKLTRLLRDSLGGNSATVMLACCSPSEANLQESLSTLRYAARARNIKNVPVVNKETDVVGSLRAELEALRAQMAAMLASTSSAAVPPPMPSPLPPLSPHRPPAPGLVPGISLQALLEATGSTEPEEIIDRLAEMRKALEECPTLRSRAEEAENETARLTAELERVRSALHSEADQRALSDMRANTETQATADEPPTAKGKIVPPGEEEAPHSAVPIIPSPFAVEKLRQRIVELERELQQSRAASRATAMNDDEEGNNEEASPLDEEEQFASQQEEEDEGDNEVFVEDQEEEEAGEDCVGAMVNAKPVLRGRRKERRRSDLLTAKSGGSKVKVRDTSMISDGSLERALAGVDPKLLVVPEDRGPRQDAIATSSPDAAVEDAAAISAVAQAVADAQPSSVSSLVSGLLPSPSVVAAVANIDSQSAQSNRSRATSRSDLSPSASFPMRTSDLRAAMERNAETLKDSIAAKERLVAALLIKDVQFERLRTSYENKMAALTTQIASLLEERDAIVAEMERHNQQSSDGNSESVAAVTASYEKKLAAVEQALVNARAKAKKLEDYRSMRQRTSAEVERLQAELVALSYEQKGEGLLKRRLRRTVKLVL